MVWTLKIRYYIAFWEQNICWVFFALWWYRSLGAPQAPTSSCRPFWHQLNSGSSFRSEDFAENPIKNSKIQKPINPIISKIWKALKDLVFDTSRSRVPLFHFPRNRCLYFLWRGHAGVGRSSSWMIRRCLVSSPPQIFALLLMVTSTGLVLQSDAKLFPQIFIGRYFWK